MAEEKLAMSPVQIPAVHSGEEVPPVKLSPASEAAVLEAHKDLIALESYGGVEEAKDVVESKDETSDSSSQEAEFRRKLKDGILKDIFPPDPIFEVEVFAPVAAYSYNVQNDLCGICRKNLMEPSGTQRTNGDTHSTQGECGHAFHTKCINKWLQPTGGEGVCPTCRTNWVLSNKTIANTSRFTQFLTQISRHNQKDK